jgi:glycosyltransferase involved in cell wall biosynthesis
MSQVVNVIIPTRNRMDSLVKTLESIIPAKGELPKGYHLSVTVIFDGLPQDECAWADAAEIISYDDCLKGIFPREHKGAVWCRNRAIMSTAGHILYATDDITFGPGAIANAVDKMDRHAEKAPALGFFQRQSHHPAGVALLHEAFVNSYPSRQVFFPGYWHFACQEIQWKAEKEGSWWYAGDSQAQEDIWVDHQQLMTDSCGKDARSMRTQDHDLIMQRQEAGLIWGT